MSDKEFRIWIDNLFTGGKCDVDWTNNYTWNLILSERIENKVKKHPLIWKLFFMVIR